MLDCRSIINRFVTEDRKKPIAVMFGVALICIALSLVKLKTDRMLDGEVKASAVEWANYLISNVDDLDEIFEGKQPSTTSIAFFKTASKFGDVFRYKFFGPDGSLRLLVGKDLKFSTDGRSLKQEKKDLAGKILHGDIYVHTKSVRRKNRPSVYSEAYVPVIRNGVLKGVVEVYVDLTKKAANFQNAFVSIGLIASCLIALAFGIPAYFWTKAREQRKLDEETWFLAHHDSLTGLANRANFISHLEQVISTSSSRDKQFAILYLDFDGFKEVNDKYGHDMGDLLLVEIANRLTSFIRDRGNVARLGGAEFGIAIEHPSDVGTVTTVADELIEFVSRPMSLAGHQLTIGCSVGIALYPEHGENNDALLTCADLAMYRAKAMGRRTACIYDQSMADELHARRDIEHELRNALKHDRIELYFQPIFSAQTNPSLIGFEALARLRQQDNQLLSPDGFVAVAEELGLIDQLGEMVLAKACRAAADWPSQLKLSVNVSPKQFLPGDLPKTVASTLLSTNFSADRLVCEVTEGLLLQDDVHVLPQIEELKRMGVKTSVDDFGVGYSSLSYLWKFNFDQMKVDRSLVARVVTDAAAANVLQTVVTLGHSLNMEVTVEGIETFEQQQIAICFGCNLLQGYHLSEPLSEVEVVGFLLNYVRADLASQDRAKPQLSAVG